MFCVRVEPKKKVSAHELYVKSGNYIIEVLQTVSLQFTNLELFMITRKFEKNRLGSFFTTPFSDCFCHMLILSIKNGLFQIKIV